MITDPAAATALPAPGGNGATATTAAPTMTVSADIPGQFTYSLECRVDGGVWQRPCPVTGTHPGPLTKSLSGLTEGDHTVVARQRQTAADSSTALSVETSIIWTVDLTPPDPPAMPSQLPGFSCYLLPTS